MFVYDNGTQVLNKHFGYINLYTEYQIFLFGLKYRRSKTYERYIFYIFLVNT